MEPREDRAAGRRRDAEERRFIERLLASAGSCPLCPGGVINWTIVEPGESLLDAERRSRPKPHRH